MIYARTNPRQDQSAMLEQILTVMGRTLTAARAAGRAARFSFAELCEQPLAARDYLALAARFDTPSSIRCRCCRRPASTKPSASILLIDTLYDRQPIRLVLSAAAPPDALYQGRKGAEAFEFQRSATGSAKCKIAPGSRPGQGSTASKPARSLTFT